MRLGNNVLLGFLFLLVVGGIVFVYNKDKQFHSLDGFLTAGGFNNDTNLQNQVFYEKKDLLSNAAETDAVTSKPTNIANENINSSAQLLPNDNNAQWGAGGGPINQPDRDAIMLPDLLQAGAQYGILGPTMKNANLQLRSDPKIEKADVGPWLMSSIDANSNDPRPFFEISPGSCAE